MNNIVRLFTDDIRRIGRNAVTIIIVLGLVILPSIFSWYNILACWNVFDNTGNLKVAVANVDEGYESSLVPVKVNIGERVVSALRANDQLEWVFTDEEDAIDGARSGRYYAAVVIPASFSSDMMSFYSSDVEHARITYYSNQKKSAIAPKVTDQGADRVANQVNRAFAEALSEIAIGISSTLIDQLNSSDLNSRIGDLCNHMDRVCTHMNDSAEVIALYSDILTSSQSLLSNSSALISQTKASADEVAGSAADAKETALTTADALSQASDALSEALQNSADSYQDVPAAIDNAFAAAGSLAADTASALRGDAATVNAQIEDLNSLVSKVTALRDFLPEGHRSTPDALIDKLNASIAVLQQLSASLEEAATKIETGSADAQAERDSIKQQAEQACAGLSNVKTEFESNVQPQLEELSNSLSDTSTAVSDTAALLDSTGSRMAGSASSLDQKIGSAKGKLDSATAELKQAAAELSAVRTSITEALASNDIQRVRSILGSDPAVLAAALSAPVQLERIAVFPVDNFGSAMAPLYTTLALWIGALLVMVTLKVAPSRRQVEALDNPTGQQLFLGRFGVISIISLLQSTTVAAGNLLFLGVQAENPLLYLVSFWVAGLVFTFIIYTLVALFANFGKALGVVLLIVQVSGGGGSFPLKLLPEFFQNISPFLPITHAVNAMRAAMFGVYMNDFWIEIGTLALFAVPLLVMGLALNGPLSRIVPKLVARIERSKLM